MFTTPGCAAVPGPLAPHAVASIVSATGPAAEPSHRLRRVRRAGRMTGHPGLAWASRRQRPGLQARPARLAWPARLARSAWLARLAVHRSLSMACLM